MKKKQPTKIDTLLNIVLLTPVLFFVLVKAFLKGNGYNK